MQSILNIRGNVLRIEAWGDHIVRITQRKDPHFLDRDYNIVTGSRTPTWVKTQETDRTFHFCTSGMTVSVDKETGAVTFAKNDGTLYLKQPALCGLEPVEVFRNVWDNATVEESSNVDGARATAEGCETVFDRMAYRAVLPLAFRQDEGVFGFGSFEEGYGNLRGRKRYIYQQNMRACVPMLVSTRGYGILFNCGCSMVLDDAAAHTLALDCVDELDCYVIGGGSHRAVLQGYYQLTGKPPMMPRYLFGYTQSKERYNNGEELVGVVAEYRRRGIPLDVIVQDWCSWEEGQWGQKSFDRSRYPDPAGMTQALHRQHARLMLSIWPIMTGNGKDRQEMLDHGYMLGNRANYDAFNPEARKLYWEQAKRGLFDYGVDCWWCDCSEPFEADWSGETKPDEETRYAINTGAAKKYIDWDKISLYSLYHSQGIYEGMRGCSTRRVVNLTRSSYAGQHRYGTITWSGDVSAKWETLKHHIPEGAHFTCTGEPYWAFDAGAFFVKKGVQWFWNGDFDNGVQDLGYRELYVRWLEYGVFTPMLRSHGTDTPREIWRFGEEGTPFYDAIAENIRLRYSLLPYIYSLAADVSFRAGSMMKPVALGYPADKATYDLTDEYLFGDFLVCPVTEPMYYSAGSLPLQGRDKKRNVYLPQGIWYDYHTGRQYPGGQTIVADAPLDRIPLYVPAGAILVTAPVVQFTGESKDAPLTVSVFAGADGSFVLYDDDGETYDYETGAYEQIRLYWNDAERTLTFSAREGRCPGLPRTREFHIRLALGSETIVTYTGEEMAVRLDKDAGGEQ